MTKETLEGLSLSLCITDIMSGRVQESEVSRIFSSAAAPTPQKFEELLDTYAQSYWSSRHNTGGAAKALARRFHEAGKIEFTGVQDCSMGRWRVVSIVSPLEIEGRRRDRAAMTEGVSLDQAKMKTLRLKNPAA